MTKILEATEKIVMWIAMVCIIIVLVYEMNKEGFTAAGIAVIILFSSLLFFGGAAIGYFARDDKAGREMIARLKDERTRAFRDVRRDIQRKPGEWAPYGVKASEEVVLCKDEATAKLLAKTLRANWSEVHTGRCDTGEFKGWHYIRKS